MSTATLGQQKAPSDHNTDHLARLALLQANDLERLKPVKAKIAEYDAALKKGLEFFSTLPAALEPLNKMENTAHTKGDRNAALADALASLQSLKDAKLPNLLAHVEDLELEDYPEPASDEAEIDFLQRARSMSDVDRQDLLDSLNMEFGAAIAQATESVQSLKVRNEKWSPSSSDAEPATPTERRENPFAKVAAKATSAADAGKKKADDRKKFGLSTDEQFASVIAKSAPREDVIKNKKVADTNFGLGQNTGDVTTWKPVVSEKPKAPEHREYAYRSDDDAPKEAPKPKPSVRDLNSLQAQLEASFKRAANR